MKTIKHVTLAGAVSASLLISGCGGSSGGSGSDSAGGSDGGSSGGTPAVTTISGTATAPAGIVAFLQNPDIFQLAMEFLVSPAAAAITGLSPVANATVDLIRIDDDGKQTGDILATTETAEDGTYSLPLPAGVSLSGDLVVRITGPNNTEIRAQVVDETVDISPVSEFVLQKFIEQEADLDILDIDAVEDLSERIEDLDLDLAGTTDLDTVNAALEQEIGELVENNVAVVSAEEGDASTIEGSYRSIALTFELHDYDDESEGDYSNGVALNTFTFAANGDEVSVTRKDVVDYWATISGSTLAQALAWFEEETEEVNETLSGAYTDSGILSIQGVSEEDFDDEGDEAWTYQAATYNLQQVPGKNLFFQVGNDSGIRYSASDSNGDGENDTLDEKLGDEIYRSVEVFGREHTNFNVANLSGKFGLIYLSSRLAYAGIELQYEASSTATFHGDGTFDYSGGDYHAIRMDADGNASYELETEEPDTGISIEIDETGRITSAGGEEVNGFISDTNDFLMLAETADEDGSNAELSTTLMVKLPETAPSVSGNTYRLLLLSQVLGNGEEFRLNSSRFNTYIEMTSETEGTLSGSMIEVAKSPLNGNMEIDVDTVTGDNTSLTADITAEGVTLTIADEDGAATLEGFFNEDASLGIFGFQYAEKNSNPNELGLAVLVKVTQ